MASQEWAFARGHELNKENEVTNIFNDNQPYISSNSFVNSLDYKKTGGVKSNYLRMFIVWYRKHVNQMAYQTTCGGTNLFKILNQTRVLQLAYCSPWNTFLAACHFILPVNTELIPGKLNTNDRPNPLLLKDEVSSDALMYVRGLFDSIIVQTGKKDQYKAVNAKIFPPAPEPPTPARSDATAGGTYS